MNLKGEARFNFSKALDDFRETSLKVENMNILKGLHTLNDSFTKKDIEERFSKITNEDERDQKVVSFIRSFELVEQEDGSYVAPWFDSKDRNGSLDAFQTAMKPLKTQVIESMGTGGSAIVNRLREQDQIVETSTRKEAIAQIVSLYFDSKEDVSEKLVITGSNADKDKLNEAIRAEMKVRGSLDASQEVQVETIDRGYKKTVGFCPGDLIKFTAKDESKKLGIINGDEGKILSVSARADGTTDFQIRLMSDVPSTNGKVISFNTKDHCRLSHNYAISIHSSQGQGRNEVFKLISENAKMENSNLDLVSFTRCKRDYKIVGSESDLSMLAEKLEKEQVKMTTLDMALVSEAVQHQRFNLMDFLKESVLKAAVHVEEIKNTAFEKFIERVKTEKPLPLIEMKPVTPKALEEIQTKASMESSKEVSRGVSIR